MVDLHAHLPMYCVPGAAGSLGARARYWTISDAGRRSGNFVPEAGTPRVSVPGLARGGVELAASVLHSPFDEIAPGPLHLRGLRRAQVTLREIRRRAHVPDVRAALSLALGSLVAARPPNRGAFRRLIAQMDAVESFVRLRHAGEATFARSPREAARVRASGRVALVHAVEGGFHLPPDPADVPGAVAELARRGVAYVTLAHLFHRGVATVAPAIPYFDEALYHELFPQPAGGLTERGRAAVAAMVREGVLLDVSHMSETSLRETFDLLDRLDPGREVPVLASHVAVRLGSQRYNLARWALEEIVARGGLVGLIAATHQLADGSPSPAPATFDESMQLLFRHVDAIADVAGGHGHTAIGTDLGGFIEPLPGVGDCAAVAAVRAALERRYGEAAAEAIARGNAQRVLESHWGRAGRRRPVPAG